MAGKGDTYRKVDKQKFDQNYDRIFHPTFRKLREMISDVKDENKRIEFQNKYENLTCGIAAEGLVWELKQVLKNEN